MQWGVLHVLIEHVDDIVTTARLASVSSYAPSIPPHLIREERARRETIARLGVVLSELKGLKKVLGIWSFILCDRDNIIDDRTPITKWYRVENEGEIEFTGHVDDDGVPDFEDLEVYHPVLRPTGFVF